MGRVLTSKRETEKRRGEGITKEKRGKGEKKGRGYNQGEGRRRRLE